MDYESTAKEVLTAYNAYRRLQDKGPRVPYTALEVQVLAAVIQQGEARGLSGWCHIAEDDYQEAFITCFYGDIMLRVDMSTVYKYRAKKDDPDNWTTVEIDYHDGDPDNYILAVQLKMESDGTIVPHEKGWRLVDLIVPNRRK